MKKALLALIVALVIIPVSQGDAATHQTPGLPLHGVLAPGVSLAGVHIGDTAAKVKSVWGRNYKLCPDCKGIYWYYIYTHGDALGAAVKFSKAGRVVAVFTLGSPNGWRTKEGLGMGEQIDKVTSLYGQVGWHACIGYGAMSMRSRSSVTSIYTSGAVVYGFAITAPAEPICQ